MNRLIEALMPVMTFIIGVSFGIIYHEDVRALLSNRPAAPAPVEHSTIGESQQHRMAMMSQAQAPLLKSRLALPDLEVDLPLVYSDTLEETKVQEYLQEGAVVLPLGTAFGEPGNVVITAHSSGANLFGRYAHAFAQLGDLEVGQEFTVTTPTNVYTYRVYDTDVVWPNQVDKLPHDFRSTVTLVTCWPLWTNFQRLLVHAELSG